MAKPIKDTPVLKGKDSARFCKEIRANEKKTVDTDQYNKMLQNYNLIKNLVKA